jgi:hypothetical protein
MRKDEYIFVIGQVVGLSGMLVVLALAIWRWAKERREQAAVTASRSLTPPATPEQDRPDWHGAPAGKPR